MVAELAAFLAVAVVVIVTPGPDTALTIRNSIVGGRRGGLSSAAGVATGQATWALLTAVGMTALLRASQPAFLTIRILGAAYLVYLGTQALGRALRRRPPSRSVVASRFGAGAAYRQGLLSNLGNPKMIVFFVSVLPQFSGSSGTFGTLLALGLLFASMTFAWLSAYAVLVAKAGDILREGPARRLIDGVTGIALVAFGLRVAGERA